MGADVSTSGTAFRSVPVTAEVLIGYGYGKRQYGNMAIATSKLVPGSWCKNKVIVVTY